MTRPRRIIVGISGASGAGYAIAVLKQLRHVPDVESFVVMTKPAVRTLVDECGFTREEVEALADRAFDINDVGAPIASGSFAGDAMIVAPCSVRTMSAIAYGDASNLLVRAADVTLKERRRLVLMVREMPLHIGHLRTMVMAAEMGAIIAPPVPAFYIHPDSVDDIIEQTAARVLTLVGIETETLRRWEQPEGIDDGG